MSTIWAWAISWPRAGATAAAAAGRGKEEEGVVRWRRVTVFRRLSLLLGAGRRRRGRRRKGE